MCEERIHADSEDGLKVLIPAGITGRNVQFPVKTLAVSLRAAYDHNLIYMTFIVLATI